MLISQEDKQLVTIFARHRDFFAAHNLYRKPGGFTDNANFPNCRAVIGNVKKTYRFKTIETYKI